MDFSIRKPHEFEEVDDFNFKGPKFKRFLRDLKFINTYLGSNPAIVSTIIKTIKSNNYKEVTIVDIGSGGGDLLMTLAKAFRKKKIKAKLIGVDINDNCIEYAKEKSKEFSEISYLKGNILSSNFIVPLCDILVSSHFVDHLEDKEIIAFIEKAKHSVKHKILITEAERIRFVYYLFKYSGFILFSKITIRDCLNAIRRAFKKKELNTLLMQNQITNFNIKRVWAFHLLLTINNK